MGTRGGNVFVLFHPRADLRLAMAFLGFAPELSRSKSWGTLKWSMLKVNSFVHEGHVVL
jgi:hypothetical protein